MAPHPADLIGTLDSPRKGNEMPGSADALIPVYTDLMNRVTELDEILDAGLDTKSAGRRAVVNQLVKAQEESVVDALTQITRQLSVEGVTDDVKYGYYFALVKALRAEFEEPGLAYADSLVETRPTVEVDPRELEAANAERSDKVTAIKNLFAIIKLMDEEASNALDPVPRRRSLGGPKGKRAISFYTWNVNGVDFEGTLTEVAKQLGYEKPVALRDEMKEAGINLTKPPATINFETPGGDTIVGTRDPNAPEIAPDEPESDDDDDDDDENEPAPVGASSL